MKRSKMGLTKEAMMNGNESWTQNDEHEKKKKKNDDDDEQKRRRKKKKNDELGNHN